MRTCLDLHGSFHLIFCNLHIEYQPLLSKKKRFEVPNSSLNLMLHKDQCVIKWKMVCMYSNISVICVVFNVICVDDVSAMSMVCIKVTEVLRICVLFCVCLPPGQSWSMDHIVLYHRKYKSMFLDSFMNCVGWHFVKAVHNIRKLYQD